MTQPLSSEGNLSAKVTHTETTEVEQPVETTDAERSTENTEQQPDGKTDSSD